MPNAIHVPDTREFGQQLASFGPNLADQPRFVVYDGTDTRGVVPGACGEQTSVPSSPTDGPRRSSNSRTSLRPLRAGDGNGCCAVSSSGVSSTPG